MAKEIKIVTLGAATFDVFLTGESLGAKRDVRTHDYVEQFPLGAKVEVDDVTYSTGGGAANAAVTFARQGYAVAFMGKVADDIAGREIIQVLKNESVSTRLTNCDLKGQTGYSTILLTHTGERTILVYRGVSEELTAKDFDLKNLTADWIYITSLAGNLDLLETVVEYCFKIGIKVAIDPGSRELKQAARLKKLMPKLTLLKGNKEELGYLFAGENSKDILRSAIKECPYVVVTDGANGSWATDGIKVYHAGMYEDVKVVDRTGAGDAFGSGLVAALARGDSMEDALTLGSANSTSVVKYIGAKDGILAVDTKLKPMKIVVSGL